VLGPRPGRVLGLYALATMEREGPIYGYLLSERISERTDGGWRPGAGAIYPALARLAERGLARPVPSKGRRMFAVTAQGRRFLARIREQWSDSSSSGPDLSRLWAEIAGSGDAGEHVVRHIHRHLEAAATLVERTPSMRAGSELFVDRVREELRIADARLARVSPISRGRGRRPARGGA
jgi:DNA-binding PadR family transcriptional regulator